MFTQSEYGSNIESPGHNSPYVSTFKNPESFVDAVLASRRGFSPIPILQMNSALLDSRDVKPNSDFSPTLTGFFRK